MKYELNLKITIKKIEVDEHYYDIYYVYSVNGGKEKKGNINSDYDGWTIKEWKNCLQKGEALKRALAEISENY